MTMSEHPPGAKTDIARLDAQYGMINPHAGIEPATQDTIYTTCAHTLATLNQTIHALEDILAKLQGADTANTAAEVDSPPWGQVELANVLAVRAERARFLTDEVAKTLR